VVVVVVSRGHFVSSMRWRGAVHMWKGEREERHTLDGPSWGVSVGDGPGLLIPILQWTEYMWCMLASETSSAAELNASFTEACWCRYEREEAVFFVWFFL